MNATNSNSGMPAAYDLPRRVAAARRDPSVVVLEGVHALKHALRFGARVAWVATPDPDQLDALVSTLAPDLLARVRALPTFRLHREAWARAAPRGLPSPSLALASRPTVDLSAVTTARGRRPVVLLEAPTHLGNVGAAVRVAAAADSAAVVVLGAADPWHPTAVRGAAGLQFALPVARTEQLPPTRRPLVAIEPGGTPLPDAAVAHDAVLAFGSERQGLSDALRARAVERVGIPMRPGVSSLNLAAAVAAVLYGLPARPPTGSPRTAR